MDHPLIQPNNIDIRRRVVQLLRDSYSVLRNGNIIFVCGGNKVTDMRPRFREYCAARHPELQVFFPEYAIPSYSISPDVGPFDIAEFEVVIGDLSRTIVIFPEAPGSFAEAGYFCIAPQLAKKTILAMNSEYQGRDSFIALGPAVKFDAISAFNRSIQISYKNPSFDVIVERINRLGQPHRKALKFEKFKDLTAYELFCLLEKIFSLLRIATLDDVFFVTSALFSPSFPKKKVRQLVSVLIGAGYLSLASDYGHYRSVGRNDLLKIKTGFSETENLIRLEITNLINTADSEFRRIAEEASLAA